MRSRAFVELKWSLTCSLERSVLVFNRDDDPELAGLSGVCGAFVCCRLRCVRRFENLKQPLKGRCDTLQVLTPELAQATTVSDILHPIDPRLFRPGELEVWRIPQSERAGPPENASRRLRPSVTNRSRHVQNPAWGMNAIAARRKEMVLD